jgi:phosphocarrier protein FPr
MAVVELKSPLDGVVLPLEQVPDPVFAQKMVGDGLSIDPTSTLLIAPCAGTLTHLHRAGHAVTLTTHDGIEVMMHIGLDTVSLEGAGFTPHVAEGERVETGAALIAFDADFLATHAKSLLTQVVIANGERVAELQAASGRLRAGVDVCLTLRLAETDADSRIADGRTAVSDVILIPNPTGLHARPAAVLANMAKRFRSRVLVQRGEDQANAKSVVAIMGLEIDQGDKVQLIAEGPDAAEAIAALAPELAAGLGDQGTHPAPPPPPPRSGKIPNRLLIRVPPIRISCSASRPRRDWPSERSFSSAGTRFR